MGNRVNDRDRLKKLLALEARVRLREELFDRLLDGGEEIGLHTYQPMIDAGEFNPNIYIVKEGLIRGTYLDRNNEITAGFAIPGTLLISFHSYYDNEPSYYRYEACCPSVVVRIPKSHFDGLARESHEFALWVMSAHQNQLYYAEVRNRLLSGDAKSRLLQLTSRLSSAFPAPQGDTSAHDHASHDMMMKEQLNSRHKTILQIVPSKIIASYLGITEQHLSKIKKEILKENSIR